VQYQWSIKFFQEVKEFMITSRFINPDDYPLLKESLAADEYHRNTPLDFFIEANTVCSVFSDEAGPVLFVRGHPLFNTEDTSWYMVRLDIQFLNNRDAKRNMRVMLEGFPILEARAKENGFRGFLFESIVPLLRKFCIKRLGFEVFDEQFLVKYLQEDAVREVDKVSEGVL